MTIHRGILNLVSNNLAGRNPMASIDGESLRVRFALNSGDPDNEHLVREFAEGVAGLMGSAAVTRARVLSFDTSDIDHLLSPEFRSE